MLLSTGGNSGYSVGGGGDKGLPNSSAEFWVSQCVIERIYDTLSECRDCCASVDHLVWIAMEYFNIGRQDPGIG